MVDREARKKVTLVLADIAGSTALAERLELEPFQQVVRSFVERMTTVVQRYGGRVHKLGDEVVGVLGVPTAHEDDALRAVRAAAEMRDELRPLNEELGQRFGVTLRMRVGVNTGEALVSGDDLSLGGALADGQRLQRAAPPGEILLGEETWQLVRHDVEVEPASDVSSPAWRFVRTTDAAAGTQIDPATLVGREKELGQLTAAFERAVAGRGLELVTVLGEPGVGKSRLAGELAEAVESDARVLIGRCLPYGEGITYWPLVEVMKQAAGIEDADGAEEARAKLEAVVREDQADDAALVAGTLAQVLGVHHAPEPGDSVPWAARRLLEAVAGRQPLLLVLEDLQWAEGALLDLVEHLGQWSRNAPALVVCTARFELLDRHPRWSAATGPTIALDPLPPDDIVRLIEQTVGPALPAGARARIVEVAAGNPLFVEQVLSMLVDEGQLRRDGGGWSAAGDITSLTVPPSIEAILSSRIDHLTGPERDLADCAAVIGREFWLEAVAELSAREVAEPFQGLRRKRLVELVPRQGAEGSQYRFRHLLMRDAVYTTVPKRRRAELHERFADWLAGRWTASRTGELDEILGYHLEASHRYRKELLVDDGRAPELAKRAAEHLVAAGRRAAARQDDGAAAGLLARAVALLAAGDWTRAEPLVDLGTALLRGGDYRRAEEVLDEARESVRASGDARAWANMQVLQLNLRRLTQPAWWAENARREAEAVIRLFQGTGDDAGAARAWHLLAKVHSDRGEQAAAQEALEHALELARSAGDAGIEAWVRFWLLQATVFGPTPATTVAERAREDLAWARERGNRSLEGSTLGRMGEMLARAGKADEARAAFEEARRVFDELGQPVHLAYLAISTAAVEPLVSDPPAAERELRESFGFFERIGGKAILATVAPMLAATLVPQGRLDEAIELTAMSESIAAADDLDAQVKWRCARALALAERDQVEPAEALVREAVGRVEASDTVILHADALGTVGTVLLRAERPSEAAAALEAAVALYERKGDVVAAGKGRTTLESLSGTRR